MKKTEKLFRQMQQNHLIALLTPARLEHCITAYEIFSPLGVTIEIALRSKVAMDGIRMVMEKNPEALILAGTVMTAKQADQAIEAGVLGIVSADYIPEVVDRCVENDIMCIPGGISDVGKQLVQKAHAYGCELEELKEKHPYQWIHKLFPAVTETVSFLGLAPAWKGPFKGLQLVYTGGISQDNLADIVAFDHQGIYCGSALTKDIDNPEKMRQEAEKWLARIQQKNENSQAR